MTDVKSISAGNSHSLFPKTDGSAWAAGANSYGSLGDGTSIARTTPVQVILLDLSSGLAWQQHYFGQLAADPSVSSWASAPDHDGLVNLLERAFNLNPTQPGRPILLADTGTTGLPLIPATEGPGGRVFSIQYLRRKASANPSLIYTPQVCSSLDDSVPNGWVTATGTETVHSIDAECERVTIEEDASCQPKRSGRVKVTGAP